MDIKPYSKRIRCNYTPIDDAQRGPDISYCQSRGCVECLFYERILPMSWRHRMFNRILKIDPTNL